MNNERLLQLAEFLTTLDVASFTLRTWVVSSSRVESALPSSLPAGSRACPIGWLPKVCPSHWCWMAVPDEVQGKQLEVYPVYKMSTLWQPGEHDFSRGRSSTWHIQHRTWVQVHEWFDIQNKHLLDRLFSEQFYAKHEPATVAARLRQAAETVLNDSADEIVLAQQLGVQ